MRKYLLPGVVLAITLAGMLLIRYPSPPASIALVSVAERKPAPDFTLEDAAGAPVTLSQLRGKVVLVNFWATWCGPCEQEIPWFGEFQKTYADQGFTVIGASTDFLGWQLVRPFMEKRRMGYPVVIAGPEIAKSFHHVEALPTTFLIDREGRIAAEHIGVVSKGTYQAEILDLLTR